MRTWLDNNNIQSNAPYRSKLTIQLNRLANLVKWLSVRLWTKLLWVRIFRYRTVSSKEFHEIQAIIECRFTLIRVHDMIIITCYWFHVVYLIKKLVLTYASYTKHFELCKEIHRPNTVSSCKLKERYNIAITWSSDTLLCRFRCRYKI